MAALFISYAREDLERVRPLAAALEKSGHEVWWDRHIAGGEEFSGAIEQALESADVVVVVWSPTSVKSAWVRDEAAAGRDSGRLVPVSLDGCAPPLGFRQYQTIDLPRLSGRSSARALEPLMAAIDAKAGGPRPRDRVGSDHGGRSWRLGRRWIAVTVVLAALLLGWTMLYTQVLARSGGIAPKVAVGNFAVVSAGLPRALPEMLGQELVAAFGAENAVTVIAPGGKASSAPYVMDGSVVRAGEGVRISINLKNRRSGVVLWSNSYEHEVADAVAARQAAVGASQVARCGLWGASNYPRKMSDEALSLYLKWCNEHWGGSSSLTAELDAARRVAAAVPDFSFAWSAVALAAVPLAQQSATGETQKLREEAERSARRSIKLDDENPEGYMALAGLLPLDRYGEREALLRKAISVRKTECGCERQAYGDFLASVGRLEEAVEEYDRARAMRPLAPFSNLRFAQALYVVGRNDEADTILARTLELWPQATSLQLLKMKSALWTGRYDEAIAQLAGTDLPLASAQRDVLVAAFQALRSGDPSTRAKAAAGLERFAADPRRNDRIVVAMLAALGAREAALQAAAKLVRSRGLLETEVLFEPNLAAASAEPGYAALVRNLGLTNYWRSGRPPDICREQAKPSFCALA